MSANAKKGVPRRSGREKPTCGHGDETTLEIVGADMSDRILADHSLKGFFRVGKAYLPKTESDTAPQKGLSPSGNRRSLIGRVAADCPRPTSTAEAM